MIELVKKNIHMNRWKGNVSTQITLDDDFIVPDSMDDMEKVILERGEITVESTKTQGDRVVVRGKLDFHVLYRKPESGMQTLGGSIPFEETINVPDLEERDYTSLAWNLEDLSAGMINSRKLSIRAIVTLEVRVESLYDAEAAVEVNGGIDSGEAVQIETLKRRIDVATIGIRKKDTYRMKENLSIAGNKPGLEEILWSEIRLRGVNAKPLDGKVHVDGELMIFVIYNSEGDNASVQWLEESLPFSGDVELPDAVEGLIPSISTRLIHKEIEAKPDYDGEMRELDIDAVLELDMKLYEEEQLEMLSDLYSMNRELTLETGEACFDQILMKNVSKCKVAEKVKIKDADRILQICHSDASVKIDETEVKEDALHIDGVLEVQLLYLTAEDTEPIKSTTEMIPFHYAVDAKGMDENSIYQLSSGLEQLTAVMISGDTIEVKAVITLDVLVLNPVCETLIIRAEAQPIDLHKFQELPGIVGYIIQPGDSLWKIAKKFHTTVDNIMIMNGLSDNNIKSGERLILVKEITKGHQ